MDKEPNNKALEWLKNAFLGVFGIIALPVLWVSGFMLIWSAILSFIIIYAIFLIILNVVNSNLSAKEKDSKRESYMKYSFIGALAIGIIYTATSWFSFFNNESPAPSSSVSPSPSYSQQYTPQDYNGLTVCSDGWISHSTGSGTCSHHGGIRR
jgi:hypothetical protein